MSKETITEFEAGDRLDKTLAKLFPDYSRSAIEKLIEGHRILVNGLVAKPKYVLRPYDVIAADFTDLTRENDTIDLPIVYEDNDVMVINKPVGILTHSKGTFNKEGTVASFITSKLNGEAVWKSSNRAGIVHRLDRGTSGIIITAKNEAAQSFLGKQFSTRKVKKTYVAIANGSLPESEGIIDAPIERNPKKPATFRVGANGKSAVTEFKVLKENGAYSLVELKPHTGRTHQLRVHLNYLKHPIVGDTFYGGKEAPRLMLHAKQLEITLPNRDRHIFTADIPDIFMEYLL